MPLARRRFFDSALKMALLSVGFLIAKPSMAIRYLVKMKSGSSRNADIRRAIRAANAEALSSEIPRASRTGRTRSFSELGVVVVDGEAADLQNVLKEHPLVDYYEVDKEWRVSSYDDQPLPSSQAMAPWIRDVLGLDHSSPDPEVEYTGSSPVVVAVIDTGTNVSHPFLRAGLLVNEREAEGTPGVDDDGNGYVDDTYGASVFNKDGDVTEYQTEHGTHVSGLVKSIRDQALVENPEARAVQVLPVRFISEDGVGTTSGAIQALEYAASRGASVVNASWGAKGQEAYSRALFDAFAELYGRDILISVAAGNAERGVANNNDDTPYFPANFPIPALMSVASVTPVYGPGQSYRESLLSSFSNYGVSTVDIAAPGDYMDESGGTGLWSTYSRFENSQSAYIRKKGTSMAAPVVSAVAAVVRAINPSLTNYEVKQLLLSSATRSPKLSKIKSSAFLSAAKAFSAARTATSQGLRPPVPEPNFENSGDDDHPQAQERKGACGTVRDVSNDEGPLGGNSVLLFVGVFFLVRVARFLWSTYKRREWSPGSVSSR